MEFIAQKSELLDELDLIQGTVEKKSTVPMLSHSLVEARGSTLQGTASDFELAARSSCIAKVKAEGKAAVPARRLVEIIRSLPDGEIRFKLLETSGFMSPASVTAAIRRVALLSMSAPPRFGFSLSREGSSSVLAGIRRCARSCGYRVRRHNTERRVQLPLSARLLCRSWEDGGRCGWN
jgi:hypothetical protein